MLSGGRSVWRTLTQNLITLGASAAVAVGLAEVMVRSFVPVRLVGPPISVYDSTYGVRNRPNVRVVQVTPEFRWQFTSDSMGFRSVGTEASPRGGVLYLGDSFTVGYGVNDGEEYPALVRSLLAGTGVGELPAINAGRGNTGQGHWIKFLRREAPRYAPRVVVLQLAENDFGDNIREGLFTLRPDGTLSEHEPVDPGIGRRLQVALDRFPWVENSHLFGLFRQAFHSMSSGGSRSSGAEPVADEQAKRALQDRLAVALVTEAVRICREHHWPVVALLVGLPDRRKTEVELLLGTLGVPAAVVSPPNEAPDLYYRVDGHLNARGHGAAAAMIAKLIADVLSRGISPMLAP